MTAFIAAESREFSGLRRHLKNERRLRLGLRWAISAQLNGRSVILAANGPGPGLAGLAAREVEGIQNLEALVSYGFCGALDPALAVNDIFIASEVQCGADLLACQQPRQPGQALPQKLLSLDRVASTAREKSELRATGAAAVEMEAAGVASHALTRRIPFYCIRVVTDSATQDFALDFNRVRDSRGRFSRLKIVAQAARHPWKLLPELIQLRRTTNAAAATLGDFVAGCQF